MTVAGYARPFHAGRGRISVLFLHGFNSSPHALREWARLTADAGYQVSLPRLPGHGTTWRELETTRWRDWYDSAERELLALAAHSDQVFVAGHSMGGSLALRLAAHQRAAVAGLVLVNPGLLAYPLHRLAPLAALLLTRVPSRSHDVAQPGTLRHGYDNTPLRAAVSLFQLFADVRASLDLVTCPTLAFRSVSDHVIPGASTDYLAAHLSSDEVTVRELARSYHVATLDYDRDQIFSETLEFIARHSR